ncbi:MAG: sugar phosphate nucleotidyltransferase [Candidatus Aenigmarchaeota archaeon]|nr:sugar phosphate nucleotidyltransferase [Candidatus Aenigmarchaeota archaeon]
MHELVDENETEAQLAATCAKVGSHLYMRPGVKLDVRPVTQADKDSMQVVFSMGGSGTRLRHVTNDDYSKHLIDVGGKPISRHVVDLWTAAGFEDLCMLIDDTHRGTSVADYYKDGSEIGATIRYSVEHDKLGSGGALKFAIDGGVITRPFINHYPDDVIVNYPGFAEDFAAVVLAAFRAGYLCVVLCVPGKNYPYGVVEDKDGKVVDFVEKPFIAKDTNTAVFGMSDGAFGLIRAIAPGKEVKIERGVLQQLAHEDKMLKVLLPTEMWIPVNDDPNLTKLMEVVGGSGRA